MIEFNLNGTPVRFAGDPTSYLLPYLRDIAGIRSPKDGCSGQGACGACMVEMNGKPTLSCVTPMKKVSGAKVVTIEGFPPPLRKTLGDAFAAKGAVQCGFCTPGFLSRTKMLLESNTQPTREDIVKALRSNICRCTGYVKIVDAVELAASSLQQGKPVSAPTKGGIGTRSTRPDAYGKAIGTHKFINDLEIDGLFHGALKFSDHPRGVVRSVNTEAANRSPGVVRVFTAEDVPGERFTGVVEQDWPLMVAPGEETRYIGDVVAAVVAESEEAARGAVEKIVVDYEVLEPVTDVRSDSASVLKEVQISRGGNIGEVIASSAHVVRGNYRTQRIEHGFLETESAISIGNEHDSLELFSQSQGIYEDRSSIARILGLEEDQVVVRLVPTGGGFGGKEDLTVQGHAALCGYLLGKPVRFSLSRPESIRMHPKRHPYWMEYELGCDESGKLTGLRAEIVSDTGAYASLGAEVIVRSATHATGAYYVPSVDIDAKAMLTNNVPCGAMRGFGVNQVTFAMECAVDELCEAGGFDRWQFRFDNALRTGLPTASGNVLGEGVGLQKTLLAVKDEYEANRYSGLGCGIKSCGIGNGLVDESEVYIQIVSADDFVIHHGWTEMGQGVDTVAMQILREELDLGETVSIIVQVSTESKARAGMTTGSRATTLLGNAIVDAAGLVQEELKTKTLTELAGRSFRGYWSCTWTTPFDTDGNVVSHYSYGYATHLVCLDDTGTVAKVVAAHDAGRVINPTLFEGQIEGSVVMGLGYALTEDLPMKDGRLVSDRFSRLGIPRIGTTPRIVVKAVEDPDPVGPYGAKGVGEIGLIPTAGAVANAMYQYDQIRRRELPLKRRE